jgi:hypothetical protein
MIATREVLMTETDKRLADVRRENGFLKILERLRRTKKEKEDEIQRLEEENRRIRARLSW